MITLKITNSIGFDSIFDADFENEYVLTVKDHLKLIVTTRLDAVLLYNQDEHVQSYMFRLHF